MSTSTVPHGITLVPFSGSPSQAATRLAGTGPHEQYVVYERDNSWWYAGGARASLMVDRSHVTLEHGGQRTRTPWYGDPLEVVHQVLSSLPFETWRAYGWAAFELSYAIAGDTTGMTEAPLIHLIIPETEVCLSEEGAEIRCDRPDDESTTRALLRADSPSGSRELLQVDLRERTEGAYHDSVTRAVEAIHRGDLQKVILSRTVPVEAEVDFPATYLAGRSANSPARSFLLNLGDVEAVGFSPETVVEVSPAGRVSTQPLAGTRALSGDRAEDAARRIELLTDPKEIYEHAISVQVAWDEMKTVCREGSVRAEEFMTVKERGSVQHLASRVTGELMVADRGPWPALAAVFPAVTASGVPKDAAYRTIRTLESSPRGLYSGAVLTVDSGGLLDAALVLRTVFRKQGRTWLRAGAGIVGQSLPEREFEETCEKLRSISRTLVPVVDH